LILWTEASPSIGAGHLVESIALIKSLRGRVDLSLIIDNKTAAHIDASTPHRIENPLASKLDDTIIVNRKTLVTDDLVRLRHLGYKIAVIDHFHVDPMCCDVLINDTAIEKWLTYTFLTPQPQCYFGPSHHIVRNEFTELHTREKSFGGHRILVTMGGFDQSGATFRIVDALKNEKKISWGRRLDIVIGPGFKHTQDFGELPEGMTISQNVNDLGERMYLADLAISSGGNTLYELACVGTPSIVLWEETHEMLLGAAFTDLGVAKCLGNGLCTTPGSLLENIDLILSNQQMWGNMSCAGKHLVDGNGTTRIAKILESFSNL